MKIRTHVSDAERQSPTRVVVSIDYINDRGARLLSGSSCVDDASYVRMRAPWHVYWSNGVNYHNGIVAYCCDAFNLHKKDKT